MGVVYIGRRQGEVGNMYEVESALVSASHQICVVWIYA